MPPSCGGCEHCYVLGLCLRMLDRLMHATYFTKISCLQQYIGYIHSISCYCCEADVVVTITWSVQCAFFFAWCSTLHLQREILFLDEINFDVFHAFFANLCCYFGFLCVLFEFSVSFLLPILLPFQFLNIFFFICFIPFIPFKEKIFLYLLLATWHIRNAFVSYQVSKWNKLKFKIDNIFRH